MAPYRVLTDGSVMADTADEALDLQERMVERRAGKRAPRQRAAAANSNIAPEERVSSDAPLEDRLRVAYSLLKRDNQRRLLRLLYDRPQGIDHEVLTEAIGIEGARGLGGLFSGISVQAGKAHLNVDDVVRIESNATYNGMQRRQYFLADGMRAVMDDQLVTTEPGL
jgi:hypothetical protein